MSKSKQLLLNSIRDTYDMALTLYMMPLSPAARAVLMCSKASGIDMNLKVLDLLKGEHLTVEYLKISPQHTIPTLVEEDDGFILCDSHAIMAYLVDKYGKDKSLYPSDLRKRATVDHRLHFDSSVLYVRGFAISKAILIEGGKEINPHLKLQLQEAFEIVEKFLENSKWIAGDELTIADFSFVTSITSWCAFEPLNKLKYPKILAWLEQMKKLPYYNTTNQSGLDVYMSVIKSKLSQ